MDYDEYMTEELLEAIEIQREMQAQQVKETNLRASSIKILEATYSLLKAKGHIHKQRECMRKLHKMTGKWLATDAL